MNIFFILWQGLLGAKFYNIYSIKKSNDMTAVQYLVDQVEQFIGLIPVDVIEKAKKMGKEQIKDAFQDGSFTGCGCYDYMREEDAEQYYNETFKQIT